MYHQPGFQAPFPRQPNNSFRGRGFSYSRQPNRWKSAPGSYNEDHWCETCDRGFATADLLENHKQQHEKCNIDGCQFVAHPKVITKHIQMQHSTGLFSKIGNLSKPEDIQKWREERKKKYPTKQNVEMKIAQLKEKIDRGEKMGIKFNKYEQRKKQQRIPGEAQKRKYPFDKRNQGSKKKVNPVNNSRNHKNETSLPPTDDNRKLKPFGGFQYLMMEEITSSKSNDVPCTPYTIEDYDEVEYPQLTDATIIQSDQPSVCSALSSLMCDYGSSDDDAQPIQNHDTKFNNNPNPHEPKQNERTTILEKPKVLNDSKEEIDDDSGPEEIKVEKSVEKVAINNVEQASTLEYVKGQKVDKNKKHSLSRKPRMNPKSKLPSTLLEKLLQKEIKQERNIVLQCVRHIVRNNFFDT